MSVSMIDTIQFAYEGADVRRFHTRPGLRPNTDGQHSWGVALLVWLLTGAVPRAEVLLAALTHDLGEHVVGDVPRPTKIFLELGNSLDRLEDGARAKYGLDFHELLTPAEARALKLADTLDGMLWCAREAGLGSKMTRVMYYHWYENIKAFKPLSLREAEVVDAVSATWLQSISHDGPRSFANGHDGL